jgi:AbrB family looped-hinge helix DNA binding protein
MPQVKVQSHGQVKIPSPIFSKYHLREGDTLDVRDTGDGIFFIPKTLKRKNSKDRLFELIEDTWARNRNIDSKALDRVINRAVRKVRDEERKALDR